MEREFSPTRLPLFTLTILNYFYAYIRSNYLGPPTKTLTTLQFHKQMFTWRFLKYEIHFEVTLCDLKQNCGISGENSLKLTV